ncbi:FG-GAP-like repeat-containing protein [Sediminibacterium sp.]|uniref:FG-GAP-like repeat-containing protein n=1 Tax=Sediminibacterium sp. TaxID=1917865 RepID=UPI002735B4E9|nr:FG-GAP-like repeat-containing protein [Sediminibacterium sp.]MDP3392399.1 FG-GAP-like repeat-containing protein [Sediminibacterium sp.]MDP3566186.1 FG-GAP-like repeat-containing protein [Sediminibacterium sp.]
MRNTITSILLLFIFFSIYSKTAAQTAPQSPDFAIRFGTNSPNYSQGVWDVHVDNAGNTYAGGNFNGTSNFNPSGTAINLTAFSLYADGYVAKYNSSGIAQWVIPITTQNTGGASTNNSNYVSGVTTDVSGNVYVTGFFYGTVDFDPSLTTNNLTSAGAGDIFIAKYNSNGQYQWAYRVGGTSNDIGVRVKLDGNGNVFVAGKFGSTSMQANTTGTGSPITLTNTTTNGANDVFILKYTLNGVFQQAVSYGGASNDDAYDLAIDGNNNVFLAGSFAGTVSVNSLSITSNGNYDAYLLKTNNDLTAQFLFNLGGTGADKVETIAIDGNNDVIIAGNLSGAAGTSFDVNPSPSQVNTITNSVTAVEVFVAKYGNDGSYKWAIAMSGSASHNSRPLGLGTDACNNVVLGGAFTGTINFNPSGAGGSFTATSSWGAAVAKFSEAGNFLWGFIVTAASVSTYRLAYNKTINKYAIGGDLRTSTTYPNADFDPTSGSNNLSSFNSTHGAAMLALYPDPGNVIPTITLGSVANVATSATSFNLPYSATTAGANQYSITTSAPTPMNGFTTVNNSSLVTSPINVTIPASPANTYNFNLTVKNSTTSCMSVNNPFTVTVSAAASPPTITSFTPSTAKPGDAVTIIGTNFNSTTTNNIVFFGATRATVTAATATSLTVTVPIGATYAPISVLNTGSNLSALSLNSFTPIFSPAKTNISSLDFSPKQDFATASASFTLAIADIDGDGKSDIVASNYNSNSISLYRNTSTSGSLTTNSFAPKVDFTTGNGPWFLTINDLNGDGKPDIIIANINASTISIFKNTSTSGVIDANSFASKVDISVGTAPSSIAVGDLDGDGKPDLAIVNNISNSNTISILRNLSTGNIDVGSFSSRVTFSTGTLPSAVALLDVDGDGKLDLAVTNQTSNSVSIFRNNASSGSITTNSFESKVDFPTASNPRYLAVGDFDGDGKSDIVVPNMNSNTVSVFRNTASSGVINTNSFAAKVDFTAGNSPYLAAIGDLNGDGKQDIAVSNNGSSFVSVFQNTSSGNNIISFASKVDFASAGSTRSVAIGDLDGDGMPDLAAASGANSFISVFRNTVIPSTPPPIITSFTPLSAKPGDVVTITGTNFNTTPANNIVFFGATRATVTASTATQLTVTVPAGATYGPITELNTGSSLAAYSLSNFNPIYSPAKTEITTTDFSPRVDFAAGTSPAAVAIGDLDGDGKPDMVVLNRISNLVSVYRSTSTSGSIVSGSFADKVDFTTGTDPRSIAIGDLDGDGKPDLAVANQTSKSVSVLRNTSTSGSIGSGSFAAKVDFATGANAPNHVAINDLDGDGKLDLVVAGGSVLRNTSTIGTVSFAAKQDFNTGTGAFSVVIGDLDGDGKPDLAVTNFSSTSVSVFRNISTSGTVSFATKVDFPTGAQPRTIAIGDLDGDGKPDLAVSNQGTASVSVLRNISTSGTVNFATKYDLTTGNTPISLAIGDLDGDGKPDLAVTNYTQSSLSVFRNISTIGSIGSGSFADKVDFTSLANPYFVTIGDLDGDGKPDLVAGYFSVSFVSVIRNTEIPPPSITSATFDASTGVLVVTGVSLTAFTGANNDIDVSKITLTGQGGSTYTLTTANVEITNATSFSVTLNATDRAALVSILNKNGTSSQSATTYNLAAAANWLTASAGNADLTGNAITVSKIATITSSGTLTAINTNAGTASANTSFTISGADMAAGILITPPSGFELSTSANGPFTSTLTVGAAGAIATTTVYVRLAATTAAGTYSGNIVLSSLGAASVNIATISSTVTAVPLITSTNNFTSFTTCAGIVSTEQLFTVRGQFLTADLVITAPTGFEISQAVLGTGGAVIASTGSYSNSITLTRTADNVPSTSLFIRLSTSAVSTTTAGNISCTTTGGTTVNIPMVATISTSPVAPSISAASSLSVCAGNSVALTSTLGTTGNALAWFRNGVSINNTITTYNASIAGSYTTVETSSNGCASNPSIAAVVVVNAVPEATITQGSQLAFNNCETTSVNLNANTGTGLTYQWRLNEVDIVGANASTYAVKQAGNYTVRVSNSSNCSIESTVTNVVTVPSATVTGATNVCAGSTVSLTANATGFANPTYQWLKDGAVINNATAASFGATQTGSYSVRITSGTLVSTSCPVSITVNPLPLVTIAAAPSNSVCVGTSAALNATSATATSYQWFNGTSAIAAATGLSLAITESGTYTVKVTDANGCVSTSDASTVAVNSLPIIAAISGANQVNIGSNITLFNTTSGGVWSSNNSAIATINTSTGLLNAISAGSVKVLYTVQNANGCSSFVSTTILVNSLSSKPTISTNTSTSFCAGSSVILTSSASTFNQWYKDGVVIGGANGLTYTATQTGVYTLAAGIDQVLSDGIQVTVNPLPTATIMQGAELAFTDCASSFVNITANSFVGATYQWLNAMGNILNATNQQYAVTEAGNYSVRITDANGCISTSGITKVAALPTASVTGSTIVCEGTPVSLSVDQFGYSSPTFQWKNAGVDVSGATSANFNPAVSGTYTVAVTDNAITSTSCPIAITVNPLPTGSIIASTITPVCVGTPITLTATPGNASTYQWFNTGNGIANATNNNYIANASGTYSVGITDANGCFNTIGSTTVTINAIPIVGDIVGEQNICVNTNVNFTNPTTGGLWSSSNTAVATVDQFGLVRGVSAGTATISYTVTSNSCATTVTRTVTVTAGVSITTQPTASISQCVGTNASISVVATGNNLTYQWFKNGTVINGATTSSYSDNNLVASDAGNYTVVVSSTCGSVTSISSVWTVNAFPEVTLTGTQQVCIGLTTVFASTTTGGVWSSNNTNVATVNAAGIITGVSGGTATISYTVTNTSGCITNVSRDLIVNQTVAVPSIGGPNAVCTGVTDVFTNAVAGGVWTSNNLALATITGGGVFSAINGGVVNITYTVTTAAGCISSATKQVILTTTPAKPTITRDFSSNLVSSYNGTNRWFNVSNNLNINTSTSSYNPTTDGRYKVQGVNNGCIGEWSDEFVYTTSSIGTLYPNPANTYTIASIVSDKFQSVVLQLTDVTGKVLEEIPVTLNNGQNPIRINTTRLAKGVYMLVIKGTKLTYQQLIKE